MIMIAALMQSFLNLLVQALYPLIGSDVQTSDFPNYQVQPYLTEVLSTGSCRPAYGVFSCLLFWRQLWLSARL